jgi:formylglycine-generating enzyme required for sulfatase activity
MQAEHGLRPDLVFFTGDAAFGQIGKERGKAIADQFREAHDFLTAVRQTFNPELQERDLFLVPGNHDVNRERITTFETRWLAEARSLDEIERTAQEAGTDWQRLLGRLDDYARFLDTYGYEHLLTSRDHLIYADAREVAGLRVGIAGFNSAWSSRGAGREELGRLWMAGRFQLETLVQQMPAHDFAIALVHHPGNWLVPEENPHVGRLLERDFAFLLHGHEHQEWVRPNASNGHTTVSAGACHEWSESKENGYNFVRLNLESGTGEVWLRQYDSQGGGWVPRCIANRTDDHGCWRLEHLQPWLGKLIQRVAATAPAGDHVAKVRAHPKGEPETRGGGKGIHAAADYETRYRKSVVDRLDFVQLFGIDVPKESKELSLSVAYVTLNLTDEEPFEEAPGAEAEDEAGGAAEIVPTALSAEEVFDSFRPGGGRLLIRGSAGCGKTTLVRWAAVQAGRGERVAGFGRDECACEPSNLADRDTHERTPRPPQVAAPGDWRNKVPFVIRLRDCSDGRLPRPSDFPLLLAKELPDPPAGWSDEVLRTGRGLVMFDGADEVSPQARDEVVREIRHLMHTYPDNYYVVTTRPEAIDRLEFRELGFFAARVEPMTAQDRDTFIDRWHEAMEVRLRNWGEPADLRPLGRRLKQRLEETPTIARLTINPLLCAVVCALHRQRYENLPETPVELCEKLCEMLLHRRDLERPGMAQGRNLDPSYNKLDFRVRKGLLSKLAHHMVTAGVSATEESVADQQIAEALQSYQLSDVDAVAVRRALVERSGMLQESSGRRIELLHNTLKEFLAAERFANGGEVELLARHAEDSSWQPVILFAVALPRDGSLFATELVRAILKRTPLKALAKGRSRAAREEAADVRRRQFFFFRCCTNAYQLNDDEITAAFEKLSTGLLPPRNMTDAEALAACGDTVVPYLARQEDWTTAQRAACVRTLGLIGGPRAKRCLASYTQDSAKPVHEELNRSVGNPLEFPGVVAHIEEHERLPDWVSALWLVDRSTNQIRDVTGLTPSVRAVVTRFFKHAATQAIEDEIAVRERHLLAIAMGWQGDPRVTVDLRVTTHCAEHPGFINIPAGQYYIGEEKKRIRIKEPFWLSKYPVTNSQFALFVGDNGYGRREFWSDQGWQWIQQARTTLPEYWRHPKYNAPTQPVVGVSWWEAEAFCRWAGGFLPTEQQWEAAARGPDGYEYPWGNDWEDGICNTFEAKLGCPSAVGIFPRARSVFGLEDMAGNVWEWCSDPYGGSSRVIRGGGWLSDAGCCRAASRYGLVPSIRNNGLGFRLARAVPSGQPAR